MLAGATLCLSLPPQIKERSSLRGVCGTSGSLRLLRRQNLRSLEWAWKVESSPWCLVLGAMHVRGYWAPLAWGRVTRQRLLADELPAHPVP